MKRSLGRAAAGRRLAGLAWPAVLLALVLAPVAAGSPATPTPGLTPAAGSARAAVTKTEKIDRVNLVNGAQQVVDSRT